VEVGRQELVEAERQELVEAERQELVEAEAHPQLPGQGETQAAAVVSLPVEEAAARRSAARAA
jgi:hypothetical protein